MARIRVTRSGMRALRTLLVVLVLALAPRIRAADPGARYEEPWMTREGQVAVLVTVHDTLRGFHKVALEVRDIEPDAAAAPVVRPLLGEKEHRWLASHGEYELYRADLAAARAKLRAKLLYDGWQPLRPCALAPAWTSWAEGERGAAAPPAGNVTLFGVALRAAVANHGAQGRVELANPATGRRSTIATSRAEVVSLGYGRRVRFDLYRVSAVALTADLEWTAVTVDSIVPLHAELAPRRRVLLVRTRGLLRELGIPLSKLGS